MLVEARTEGFREAMEIFGVTIACDDTERKPSKGDFHLEKATILTTF
jgi:hypothetical protein